MKIKKEIFHHCTVHFDSKFSWKYLLKCFLLDLGVWLKFSNLSKELLKINFKPGDLFLLLLTLGDNVTGCVELKYKFGFELGF